MAISIKELTEANLPLLETKLAFQNKNKYKILLRKQQNGSAQTLIAWAEEAPIGHIEIDWERAKNPLLARYRETPVIKAVFVHPDWRGHGVAEQLMTQVEDLARAKGYKLVGLAVATDNGSALKLYRKLNYACADVPILHSKRDYIDFAGNHIKDEFTAYFLIKKL